MEPNGSALRLINVGDSGEVAAVLASHDGIITAQQALAAGLSRHEIAGRVARGEWIRLARGLFRCASHEFTEAAMVRAVVLAHHGVADGTTAAWWSGMLQELQCR